MKKGKVKWYKEEWEKGAITPCDDPSDVEFCQSVVVGGVRLSEGNRVEFEEINRKATTVRRI